MLSLNEFIRLRRTEIHLSPGMRSVNDILTINAWKNFKTWYKSFVVKWISGTMQVMDLLAK